MRISDWSSDVCSSDLGDRRPALSHQFRRLARRCEGLTLNGWSRRRRSPGPSLIFGSDAMTAPTSPAPAIEAVQWFNTDTPPSLDALRGRVVVIETVQMLCPDPVSPGLPPARRIRDPSRLDAVRSEERREGHQRSRTDGYRAWQD